MGFQTHKPCSRDVLFKYGVVNTAFFLTVPLLSHHMFSFLVKN